MHRSLGRTLALPLAPVLLWQGRRVRRDTPVLPEAVGERDGVAGAGRAGRPLRLLIVGDSSAAGVGASAQQEALAGQLVARLEAAHPRPVRWMLVARSGVTTAEAIALLDEAPAAPFDVAVVALGVNDVTALRPASRWLRDVGRLVERLRERHRVRRVLWSGLPPMHRFPALPQPLRGVIGLHARGLDAALARWCAARAAGAAPACEHVPMPALVGPPSEAARLVASDGFHPGPGAYAVWAEALAPRVIGGRRR
jgi:lysophospholipase L1-like esterase